MYLSLFVIAALPVLSNINKSSDPAANFGRTFLDELTLSIIGNKKPLDLSICCFHNNLSGASLCQALCYI